MSKVEKHTFKELTNPENNTPEKACALLIAAFGSPQGALNAINYASACIVSAATVSEHINMSKEQLKAVMVSYTGDIRWQKILANKLKDIRNKENGTTTPPSEADDNGINDVM